MTAIPNAACGDKIGTLTGYGRHRRNGEPACAYCLKASADYTAKRRAGLRKEPLPEGHHAHGTLNGYTQYMCRCGPCRRANREAGRANTARRAAQGLPADSPRHGHYTTYFSYGCRCDECLTATREYARQRKIRLRLEAEMFQRGEPKTRGPGRPATGKTPPLNVRVAQDVQDAARAKAEHLGRPFAAEVTRLLAEYADE